MAGFECATGWNRDHHWIDQVEATEHDRRVDEDYAAAAALGLQTVREGVRWPVVDRGRRLDYSTLDVMVDAANRHGIEPIWDLFHYGYPHDEDPFSDRFAERFASYCQAVARRVKARMAGPHWFTPVNEPSYFAWAAGDANLFAPHCAGRSYELKVKLVRAAIQGIDAIRGEIPDARILNVDPICRVVPPRDRPDLADEANGFNEHVVFQAFDMLGGRLHPELGGSPAHLGTIGINYYWTNQWVHGRPEITLAESDERCWPLRDLIRWVWHRYGHDVVVSETSHSQSNKAWWTASVAEEAAACLREGIPLRGVCLYPVLGMPEWHDRTMWAHMGLWEVANDGTRTLHQPMADALRRAQRRVRSSKAYIG
ncbi:family 1 glycosylhydrolase [Fimbriimonas ginsengisoli]|uniref:Beta-glucosidase n=1 Tax=Fimbriimonas ginsengisoli Gsoil 348 TaxID=661478 RepID=A0A068NL08_FIMGI|nr:family 1 glycosylhydrolase [Fimbriimonas ginsengisoli]AIE84273.1 hypothetical protein OP10G_0905 [Fimbriimonas ginsengisoli Gsoil 348]